MRFTHPPLPDCIPVPPAYSVVRWPDETSLPKGLVSEVRNKRNIAFNAYAQSLSKLNRCQEAGKELAKIDSLSGILSPGVLASFVVLGLFPITVKKLLALYKKKFRPEAAGPSGDQQKNAAKKEIGS